jgi:hypothetical protein
MGLRVGQNATSSADLIGGTGITLTGTKSGEDTISAVTYNGEFLTNIPHNILEENLKWTVTLDCYNGNDTIV